MTYVEQFLPIKSHDHMISKQQKSWYIYYQMSMATKLGRMDMYNWQFSFIKSQGFSLYYYKVTWKIRSAILYFHKACAHQNWKGGTLLW